MRHHKTKYFMTTLFIICAPVLSFGHSDGAGMHNEMSFVAEIIHLLSSIDHALLYFILGIGLTAVFYFLKRSRKIN